MKEKQHYSKRFKTPLQMDFLGDFYPGLDIYNCIFHFNSKWENGAYAKF